MIPVASGRAVRWERMVASHPAPQRRPTRKPPCVHRMETTTRHPARPSILLRMLAIGVLAVWLVACTARVASDLPSPVESGSPTGTPSPASLAAEPSAKLTPGPSDDDTVSTPTPSPIPGCGTGETGFRDHTRKVDRMLSFGDAEIELTTAAMAMLDGSFWADDAIPGFIGLTEDERAVHVGAGDPVTLAGDGMSFRAVQVTLVRWSDVGFPAGGLPYDDGLGFEGTAEIGGDGSLAIIAPQQVGEYLVELVIGWRTDCLEGDGTAYGRIKVD